nr:MAG TPA: Integrase [Caudoviricetes sp.]
MLCRNAKMLCKFHAFAQPKKNIKVMATIKAFIRTAVKNVDAVNVRFRLTDGRNLQLFYKSDIQVSPKVWDEKNQSIKAKVLYDPRKRAKFNNDIASMKNIIAEVYNQADKNNLTSDLFAELMDRKLNPQKYIPKNRDIFLLMEKYTKKHNLSIGRILYYKSTANSLRRYEIVRNIDKKNSFKWDIDKIDVETLEDFEYYLHNEHVICSNYPEITLGYKGNEMPRAKGDNMISVRMSCFKAFLRWCYEQGFTTNNEFSRFKKKAKEQYGTPFYLTIQERNLIADFDLSDYPILEEQRDIFIFQCLIGCRVSDLFKLTRKNIINEAIEYIPHKTKEDRPIAVRVPLNNRAKALINKYKGKDRKGRLFPFYSSSHYYNKAIRQIFSICKIDRVVTVLNKTTREEEKRPINEIASSHIARRTFVGNLYKKVKDPNLVGSLSGHKEGSIAFVRYREIDDEIKKDLVKLIE